MITTLILSIAISWVIVKIIKTIIAWKKEGINWKALLYDGGMPSSHTALAVSTATSFYLDRGAISTVFILSVILALIVMNDALKVRKVTEEQSKVINKLTKGKKGFPKLDEHIGHTPSDVFVGLILGIIIPIIIYALY